MDRTNQLDQLVAARLAQASLAVGYRLPVTWDLGPYSHFRTRRGYGVTFPEDDGSCHIRLATKIVNAPRTRLDGVLRHEIGHVVDHLFAPAELNAWGAERGVRLSSTSERRADDIAFAIWGEPIRYDKDTVQNTRYGVCPRPRYLGL